MSNTKFKDDVTGCIEAMVDYLNKDLAVSKETCDQVGLELSELKNVRNKKLREYAMNKEIDVLLDEFCDSADDSKEFLNHLLEIISAGKVPDLDTVRKLDSTIENLRDRYEIIQVFAQEVLLPEEMPEKGASAFDLADAVNNSKAILYRKQLEEIKNLLERFVAVKALVDQYTVALAPFQEKAKSMLVKISEEDVEIENAIEESSNAVLFMEALEHDNASDSKGAELLKKVAQNMDFMVQLGLATKNYYLPDDSIGSNSETDSVALEVVSKSEDIDELSEDREKSFEFSMETEDDTEESSEDCSDRNQLEEETDEVEREEQSNFAKLLIEKDLIFSYDDFLGKIVQEVSVNENKKISASIFTNDIRQGDDSALLKIIRQLSNHIAMTESALSKVTGLSDDRLNRALQYLTKKGYIKKCSIKQGELIIPSMRLKTALGYKSVSKFADVQQNCLARYEYMSDGQENNVASFIAKSKLLEHLKKNAVKSETVALHEDPGAFSMQLYFDGKKEESHFLLGFFWNDTEYCDVFQKYFEKQLEACNYSVSSITVAALTEDLADTYFDVLSEIYPLKSLGARIGFYDLEGDYFAHIGFDFDEDDDIFEYEFAEEDDAILDDFVTIEIESEEEMNTFDDTVDIETDSEEVVDATSVGIAEMVTDREEEMNVRSDNTADVGTGSEKEVDVISDSIAEIKTEIKEDAEEEVETGMSSDGIANIETMLYDGYFYAATAYARADAELNPKKSNLYNQLKYAFNDPAGNCSYTSDNLYSLISDNNDLENALVISSALRTFFSNQMKYDYNIRSVYSTLNDYDLLDMIPQLRKIMYDLSEFKSTYNTGLDHYADYHKHDEKELDFEIAKLRKEAMEFYNKNVAGVIKEKTGHRRFLETIKQMFSPDSELGMHLKFVVDGEVDSKILIEEFLMENFYSTDSMIEDDTIDSEMLWNYIQNFWDDAGKQMAVKKRDDLKSHLRNNIINRTTKVVQILAKWCNLVEMRDDRQDDEGALAYRKLKKSLTENIEIAIDRLNNNASDTANSRALIAGMKVIRETLMEIRSRLDGAFDPNARKYFYIDFLLTDNVILDELYLPDFDIHDSKLDALSVKARILKHLMQLKSSYVSLEDRLGEIIEEQGDDFGSAKLIVEYLSLTNPDMDYESYTEKIDSSIEYARETAQLRKLDFVGELELAQSYGQMDNSAEDQKEKILQAVDEWFEWADSRSNYGFFKKVIDEYLSDIRRNAKKRENDILTQLEAFKSSSNSELSLEAKERKVRKILAAVKEQNYTVAEDLLSRDDFDESGVDSLIEEDFLKDFLENYDDFYRPVAAKKTTLANLVKNRARNKEARGAQRLVDNWLPGGSKMGKNRLGTLLNTLGFDVEDITEQKTVGRFEEYEIRTVGGFQRQRNSYTHPIAALGSGAAEAGFRVVCLNGSYEADKLINLMQQIGNAKHTLILLDYALPKDERRRLARKIRSSLGDRLFVVLDRTVMMYLIRNYDETKINRMLVSLITPFAYYQPYVWESANVMPPEIFMGRKIELEKIKSPTGVNIVYGGRQLGKSALLKKAKEDIDWNENGDRAIYIDIKGLDYKETARKVSLELIDQFILDEDSETDNWDELARSLRRKLNNSEKKIPYLLLLLDEADAFIESCGAVNYKPFDSLKEVQNVGVGRFKFVVAGLRDIVRFKRDALANNSVLTHLEPMTVTPFKFSEARELLEIPLHYLGLRFSKEKESLITLIMATANYFPGLIQLYCAKLIDAMRNKDYAGYDEVDSPIYEVSEDHIKRVLADPEFMQQIREKYIITLKLDEDNYYHLIALIMAWLYHNEKAKTGYSAEDIKRVGTEYEIKKLADLDLSKLENFCEELKELNVLRKIAENRYLFTRHTFFQMMGTSDEVDNALLEYMEA